MPGERNISQSQLAKRINKKPQQIGKYRQRTWWKWGDPPYSERQAKQIEEAVGRLPPDNNAPHVPPVAEADGDSGGSDDPLSELRSLSPERRAKLQLVVERAAKLKIERELLLGEYLRKVDVERGRVERVHAVKGAMLSVPDSGVVESIRNAETETEAREILRGRMIEICQEFNRS